jgi:argininosuccinate lyase
LTELADTLVRDHDLPFALAHAVAGRLMEACERQPSRPMTELLAGVSHEMGLGRLTYADDRLKEILSPQHFVDVRQTAGGPARTQTERAAIASREELAVDRMWLADRRERLDAAAQRLSERRRAL